MEYFILVIFSFFGNVSASTLDGSASDILPVVNTATNLIALTITPVFLAMISKTGNFVLPRMVFLCIVVILSIIYGVMAIVLSVMLISKLLHTWLGTS